MKRIFLLLVQPILIQLIKLWLHNLHFMFKPKNKGWCDNDNRYILSCKVGKKKDPITAGKAATLAWGLILCYADIAIAILFYNLTISVGKGRKNIPIKLL
uniref:Uncharacterized protein n=1 Tax=Amanita phalloides TaxID=67723 RepID=A0A5Q0N382_AMAPH|nr:hypothetical protein [Amanita phalloides]QFZ98679.1 hypothetical protein [Amanita phalloides]WLF85184.1 hypothetical protein [Amanita phalloides]